jgi:hypothetical protein
LHLWDVIVPTKVAIETSTEFPVLLIRSFRRGNDGRILSIDGNATGRVCISTERVRGDVTALQTIVESAGGIVFICAEHSLNQRSRVPTICLDRSLVEKLFSHGTGSRPIVDLSEHIPTSLDDSSQGGPNLFSLVTNFVRGAVSGIGRKNALFQLDSTKTHDAKSMLKQFFDIGMKVHESQINDEMIKDATLFLRETKWQDILFYQIVAAAALSLKASGLRSRPKGLAELETIILRSLGKCQVNSLPEGLLDKQGHVSSKTFASPNHVLSKFLKMHIDRWDTSESARFVTLLFECGYFKEKVETLIWLQMQPKLRPLDLRREHIDNDEIRLYIQIGLCERLQEAVGLICHKNYGVQKVSSLAQDRIIEMAKLGSKDELVQQLSVLLFCLLSSISFVGINGLDKQLVTRKTIFDSFLRDLYCSQRFSGLSGALKDSKSAASSECQYQFKSALRDFLREKMKVASPTVMKNMGSLVRSNLSGIVRSDLRCDLLEMLTQSMASDLLFCEKLRALLEVWSAFIGGEWLDADDVPGFQERVILILLKALTHNYFHDPLENLKSLYEFAAAEKGISFSGPMAGRIAMEVVKPSAVSSIIRAPQDCRWLNGFACQLGHADDKCYSTLCGCIQLAILQLAKKQCKSMNEVCDLMIHLRDLRHSSESFLHSSESFLHCFVEALIVHMIGNRVVKSFLELYELCPSIWVVFVWESNDEAFTSTCRNVVQLTEQWIRDFERDDLTVEEFHISHHALNDCFPSNLRSEGCLRTISFPSDDLVEEKNLLLRQVDGMLDDIGNLLSIEVPGSNVTISLIDSLSEYHCTSKILNSASIYLSQTSQMSQRVSSIVTDHRELVDFVDSNSETLQLCAYFVSHRSILFSQFVVSSTEVFEFSALAARIGLWIESLSETFGKRAQMSLIRKACFLLSDCDLDNELLVLRECPLLGVSEIDVQNFETAAFVLDVEKDFDLLLRFCRKANFSSVCTSPSFTRVCELHDSFYRSTVPKRSH